MSDTPPRFPATVPRTARERPEDPYLAALRREYSTTGLSERNVAAEPIAQLRTWLEAAAAAGIREPNAMTLATVGLDGGPTARTVLLKGLDARGLLLFTSYDSRKARELARIPRAAALFVWIELERQVAVRGNIRQVEPAESDAYFATRPRGSQLGAWSSRQSEVLDGRAVLEERLAEVTARFEGQPVPRPDFWGGFRLYPAEVEFWQGRADRLHDRVRFIRPGDADGDMDSGGWRVQRLSP